MNERLEYAIKKLEENNLECYIKNAIIGHLFVYDIDGNMIQYWANTGKILGRQERGINNLIKLCYLKL